MQLGPTSRIPWRRTIVINSRSRSTPSPPTSRKPALITTSALTPLRPHSSATPATNCLGTVTTARSIVSGISSTLG